MTHALWAQRKAKSGVRFLEFKRDFRPTEDFETAKKDISVEMAEILSITERKPDDFNALNLSDVLDAKGMDFNDAYYANFCKLNRLILVTDDRDLQQTPLDITILTS